MKGTEMTTTDWAGDYLRRVSDGAGLVPATAADTLRRVIDGDDFVASLVRDVLHPGMAPQDRADTLCRLLGTFGLGTIVDGRVI